MACNSCGTRESTTWQNAILFAVGEAGGLKIDPMRLRGGSWGVANRVIATQPGCVDAGSGVIAAAGAYVHARLAARQQDHVKLVALGGGATQPGESAREHDLLPTTGVAVAARAPDAAREEGGVNRIGINWVDLDA